MGKDGYGSIVGTVVDCHDDMTLRIEKNLLLVYSESTGKILERGEATSNFVKECTEKYGLENIQHLNPTNEFILPGFIDAHVHASQYPNNGLGMDFPLLKWLEEITYPTEANFSDTIYAREVYDYVVDMTLVSGTTTAVYFATIHSEASEILCDIAEKRGQRAFVGKVNMSRNCPDFYRETTRDSIVDTEIYVSNVLSGKYSLVEPVITPRFIPSCDPELLQALGDIAQKTGVRVQSHISECKDEILWVSRLEPKSNNYADAYQRYGLLRENAIMAHGTYLSDDEIRIFKSTGSGIVHCPNSNNSLESGNMNVVKFFDRGMTKVGLGTDCSGGYSPTMLNAMRFAITTNKNICISERDKVKPLNFEKALFLATRGSAKVASISDTVGVLDIGYKFDALQVRMGYETQKKTKLFGNETVKDMVQKFIYLGDERNIRKVYVNGHCVVRTTDDA